MPNQNAHQEQNQKTNSKPKLKPTLKTMLNPNLNHKQSQIPKQLHTKEVQLSLPSLVWLQHYQLCFGTGTELSFRNMFFGFGVDFGFDVSVAFCSGFWIGFGVICGYQFGLLIPKFWFVLSWFWWKFWISCCRLFMFLLVVLMFGLAFGFNFCSALALVLIFGSILSWF